MKLLPVVLLLGLSTATVTASSLRKRDHQNERKTQIESYQSSFTLDLYDAGTTYECQEGTTTPVPANSAVHLNRAGGNFVCLLRQVGPVGRTVARSYMGASWETRIPLEDGTLVPIQDCNDEGCVVIIPNDGNQYELISLQGISYSRTPQQKQNEIARFLTQATFGPKLEEVQNFSGSYEDWIQAQMDLPASGHREYTRLASNFPRTGEAPRPEKVCATNSRWISNLAFGSQDIFKQLYWSQVGDTIIFTIDGVPRTEIPAADLDRYQFQAEYNGGYICEASGGGGMFLRKEIHGQCGTSKGRKKFAKNIPIKFQDGPPPANTVQFQNCDFEEIQKVASDSYLLKNTGSCQCTLPAQDNVFFANIAGKVMRFEDMDGMVQNDLLSPDPTGCASAPVSPINIDHCIVVQGTCSGRGDNYRYTPSEEYHLSCGSPGEVAPDPAQGAIFNINTVADENTFDNDSSKYDGKKTLQVIPKTVWSQLTLLAPDQLRQRIAFFLYGVWIADLNHNRQHETAMMYYDIFVRNAFGNYLDIAREVTYSSAMGEYLTYQGSSSLAYSGFESDENYARELAQLFTVGLHKLHLNGTVIRDDTGAPIPTYSQDDIRTMARIWTGFRNSYGRPSNNGGIHGQMNDPMVMVPERHDQFPKMNMDHGYHGDQYPLCYDFPAQDFVHKGAIYEFFNDGDVDNIADELLEGTPLYESLCSRSTAASDSCNFQTRVTLANNLGCEGLCDRQTVDLVKVGTATYRYIGRPCVTFPFFNAGNETDNGYCLDPAWKSSCCGSSMRNVPWSDVPCSPKAKIMADGLMTLYHDVTSDAHDDVSKTNLNAFRVAWAPGVEVPTPGNCGPCVEDENSCICTVEEVREPVFDAAPTRTELLEKLHIGTISPDSFSSGEYVLHSMEQGGVTVFRKAGGIAFDADTIFAIDFIPGEPDTKYLQNIVSWVTIVGAPGLKFRNPPMFNQIMRESNDDTLGAHQEVDAFLKYLVMHPNCPAFVAYRFIQRFVTSNPSAAFVERVAKAFESGRFGDFGTGRRGDMSATVAAVLLDSEARSGILDNDPTQGHLREPVVKLAHLMRSLDFYNDDTYKRFILMSEGRILQFPYEPPSVFSFFEPDFARSGSVIDRQGLIAPETKVLGYTELFNFQNKQISGLPSHLFNEFQDDPEGLADQLNTLLTGGRVPEENQELIMQQFSAVPFPDTGRWGPSWRTQASRLVKSFVLSPEFHITGFNHKTDALGLPVPPLPPVIRPETTFKAIVFVELGGGADSISMVVPHSECQGEDLYESYAARRRSLTLPKGRLLQIDVPNGQQQCNKFGMNEEMPRLHQLYQDQDLMWASNVGTKLTGEEGEYQKPRDANSHNKMTDHLVHGWANARNNTGVLGRVADCMHDQNYHTLKFSMGSYGGSLSGDRTGSPIEVSGDTVPTLNGFNLDVYNVTNLGSNVFGQYYREQLDMGIEESAQTNAALADATVNPDNFQRNSELSQQLVTVAKLIQQRDVLEMDRGLFTVRLGGWDHHNDGAVRTPPKLSVLDKAVGGFVDELKAQGTFDDVVIVMRSEFGRTHRVNAMGGTDHGWNGNYFVAGGAVKGGQVKGDYISFATQTPADQTPKYSWEHVYNGIFSWFGVLPHQMDEALPRHKSFSDLWTEADMFNS